MEPGRGGIFLGLFGRTDWGVFLHSCLGLQRFYSTNFHGLTFESRHSTHGKRCHLEMFNSRKERNNIR